MCAVAPAVQSRRGRDGPASAPWFRPPPISLMPRQVHCGLSTSVTHSDEGGCMKRHLDFDPSHFTNAPFALTVSKPWGYELVFTPSDKPYTGKLLHVQAGKRLSLQFHDEKQETIMLLRGRAILLCDNAAGELEEIAMEPGKGYSNVP